MNLLIVSTKSVPGVVKEGRYWKEGAEKWLFHDYFDVSILITECVRPVPLCYTFTQKEVASLANLLSEFMTICPLLDDVTWIYLESSRMQKESPKGPIGLFESRYL